METWPVAYTSILGKEQVDYMLQLLYNTSVLTGQMNNGHYFLLAENKQMIAGFASYSHLYKNTFKLQKLYVLPAQQKTGAGRVLLQSVEKESKSLGATKLQLSVNRRNIAKAFYERNGFAVIEEADIDIGNGYFMNDYIMEKDL